MNRWTVYGRHGQQVYHLHIFDMLGIFLTGMVLQNTLKNDLSTVLCSVCSCPFFDSHTHLGFAFLAYLVGGKLSLFPTREISRYFWDILTLTMEVGITKQHYKCNVEMESFTLISVFLCFFVHGGDKTNSFANARVRSKYSSIHFEITQAVDFFIIILYRS